jgi:hypothetical protein
MRSEPLSPLVCQCAPYCQRDRGSILPELLRPRCWSLGGVRKQRASAWRSTLLPTALLLFERGFTRGGWASSGFLNDSLLKDWMR